MNLYMMCEGAWLKRWRQRRLVGVSMQRAALLPDPGRAARPVDSAHEQTSFLQAWRVVVLRTV